VAELTGEGAPFEGQSRQVKSAFKELTKSVIRRRVVDEGIRMDGRGVTDLRPVRPRSVSSPPPTAPACSSEARPRSSTC
jgi:polyribonucleotide nucleotidyltransferase